MIHTLHQLLAIKDYSDFITKNKLGFLIAKSSYIFLVLIFKTITRKN